MNEGAPGRILDAGFGIQMAIMIGGYELPAPKLDVSGLPGVSVSVARAWREASAEITVACVHAPTSIWFEGAEQLVFERANQIAQRTISKATSLSTRSLTNDKLRFVSRFTGDAGAPFEGVHLLGFSSVAKEAVLCTAICRSFDTADCGVRIDRAAMLGDLGPPPPPGPAIATAFTAAKHPYAASMFAATIVFAIVAFILWRRPKPSPWPRR